MKTVEKVIEEQLGVKEGAKETTPTDYGETKLCMLEYAKQFSNPLDAMVRLREKVENAIKINNDCKGDYEREDIMAKTIIASENKGFEKVLRWIDEVT